jgi:hypothetical protein
MKGNVWMVGAVLLLAGFAAPSQAAVSAGNILAAPASVDNSFRQEFRVQMAAADARADTAKPAVETTQPQASQTGEAHPAEGQVVANDQLNDADRTLRQEAPPSPPVPVAATDAPAQRTVAMAGNDPSLWDETSLIGKVFIAFGTLLTVASAARMFMA